jgi:hypothetical protein
VVKGFCLLSKKKPGQRPGNKDGTGLGMPVPMARKKGESGPTPGYSVFTKALQAMTIKLSESQCCCFNND